MTIEQNESNNPYLSANLPPQEHERLVAELENNPELLRELLQIQTPEDKSFADALLFNELSAAEQDDLDGQIRRYLLRDPTFEDGKFAELENLIIEDERYLDRMLMVESELVEDRLRGALMADERSKFDNNFLTTPERRAKLKFTKAMILGSRVPVKKTAAAPAPAAKTVNVESTAPSLWKSFLAFINSPNLVAGTALAAAALFLLVGAIWWFSGTSGRQEELIATAPTNESISNINQPDNLNQTKNLNQPENTNKSSASDKINKTSPPLPTPQPTKLPQNTQRLKQNEVPQPTVAPPVNAPRRVVFALFPGVLRGGNNSAEQKLEANTKAIELQLRLDLERDYEDFKIVVQDSDGKEIGGSEKLKASKKSGIPMVTASISAESLQPDDYTVILSGKSKGKYTELAQYSFRILK